MLTRAPALNHLSMLLRPNELDEHLAICSNGVKSIDEGSVLTVLSNKSFGWAAMSPVLRSLEDTPHAAADTLCVDPARIWPEAEDRIYTGPKDRFDCDCPEVAVATPRQDKKNKKCRRIKSVTFSHVEILEFSIIMGDHPCCSSLALSLGWERAQSPTVVDIDSFEASRAGSRRSGGNLILSYYERKNILKNVGGLKETDIIRQCIQKRRARVLS